MSTCSLRYFLRRFISYEDKIVSNLLAGKAKRIEQPTEAYFDLNLLFDMISSSPKKSNLRMRLLLW